MISPRISAAIAGALSLGILNGPASAATLDPLFGNSFESGLVAFGPALSAVPQGIAGSPSALVALSVTLDQVATGPTFVPIVSSDPTRLTVSGGGATVATGETSATVLLNGLVAASAPVIVWANYGNKLGASVSVEQALNESNLGDEADSCISPPSFDTDAFTPTALLYGRLFEAGATESAGAAANWIAEFGYGPAGSDPRLLSGWHFSAAPYDSQQGSDDQYAASIVAPVEGTYSIVFRFSHDDGVSWTYCDADGAGSSGGANFDTAQLASMTVLPRFLGLVINEIDYDNVGTDAAEFVEIFNNTAHSIDLSDVALVLVNGNNNTEYQRNSLASMGLLLAGQYAVVGAPSVVAALPPGVPSIDFGTGTGGMGAVIQNGAPDGVALIDAVNHTVVDSLSYEGAMTAAVLTGFPAPVSLVEGTVLPASVADSNAIAGDLQRLPNGTDSNDAATDWHFGATVTPGTANVP